MKYKLQQRQQEFLIKAHEVHGQAYEYDLSTYINSQTPMLIVCPTHGPFHQRPRTHIEGSNCSKCVIENTALGIDNIIRNANQIHDCKYTYVTTGTERVKDFIQICCPIHGNFTQRISHHLAGHGCSQCGKSDRKLSLDEFIAKAKVTHGDFYDYSDVVYKNIHTKVGVICPVHGKFLVDPALHIQRTGCPKCRSSKLHKFVRAFLISNNVKFEEEYRFADCRNKYPLPFDFYCPDLNILIECDGEHHHKPVNFSGDIIKANSQFEITQQHDTIKTKYATDHKIKLVRITSNNMHDIRTLLNF